MNYKTVENALSKFDKKEVARFISYLNELATQTTRDGKTVNPWFKYCKEETAVELYEKVSIDNLAIDGETITLQFKGKVMVSYNYQAYKNRVLNAYPETKFDIQNVNVGDEFSFRKESGKVIYSHQINDPFTRDKTIVGAYCIIKNKRGEFLETINLDDIEKMKSVAKTKNIWNEWFSEMVLKSVIKRACKRHFKDITTNIESLDNEAVDLENRIDVDERVQKLIDETTVISKLGEIYKAERNNVSDETKLVALLSERKEELKLLLPEITTDEHSQAIRMLKNGSKPNDLLSIWKIDSELMETLINSVL